MGHWISSQGVEADGEKIKAMVNWLISKDVTELKGFLSLTGYFRRFVKVYSEIAIPSLDFDKKNAFY